MKAEAENDENEVLTGVDKAFPSNPCLCYPFRFLLIYTEKDGIDAYFPIVDQRIKLIFSSPEPKAHR